MNIKENIKSKGWTLSKIAEQLNVTQSALTQNINGNPTLARLQEIANIMQISVSELLADAPLSENVNNATLLNAIECVGAKVEAVQRILDKTTPLFVELHKTDTLPYRVIAFIEHQGEAYCYNNIVDLIDGVDHFRKKIENITGSPVVTITDDSNE